MSFRQLNDKVLDIDNLTVSLLEKGNCFNCSQLNGSQQLHFDRFFSLCVGTIGLVVATTIET